MELEAGGKLKLLKIDLYGMVFLVSFVCFSSSLTLTSFLKDRVKVISQVLVPSA